MLTRVVVLGPSWTSAHDGTVRTSVLWLPSARGRSARFAGADLVRGTPVHTLLSRHVMSALKVVFRPSSDIHTLISGSPCFDEHGLTLATVCTRVLWPPPARGRSARFSGAHRVHGTPVHMLPSRHVMLALTVVSRPSSDGHTVISGLPCAGERGRTLPIVNKCTQWDCSYRRTLTILSGELRSPRAYCRPGTWRPGRALVSRRRCGGPHGRIPPVVGRSYSIAEFTMC